MDAFKNLLQARMAVWMRANGPLISKWVIPLFRCRMLELDRVVLVWRNASGKDVLPLVGRLRDHVACLHVPLRQALLECAAYVGIGLVINHILFLKRIMNQVV